MFNAGTPLRCRTLVVLLTAIVLVLAACSDDSATSGDASPVEPDQSVARQVGQGEAREVGTGDITEGSCVDLPDSTDVLTSFTEVSCFDDHDGQLAAIFELPLDGEFPGQDEILLEAQTGCVARFEDFIGLSYDDSIYFLQSFTPTEESWSELDDRSVLCVILPPLGNDQLVGDLSGVAE